MSAPERWMGRIATSEPRGPVQMEDFLRDRQRRPTLPMGVLELAYEEYSHRYGTSQSFARMNERGGFGLLEVIGLLADLIERERARADSVPTEAE